MRNKDAVTRSLNALILALMAVQGAASLAGLLRMPSEPGSAILLGYSFGRLVVASATAGMVVLFAGLALAALRRPKWWQSLSGLARKVIGTPALLFALVAILFALFLYLLAFLVLVLTAGETALVTQRSILERAGYQIIWIELCILQLALLIALNYTTQGGQRHFFTPLRLGILLAIATSIYNYALYTYATTSWTIWLHGNEIIWLPAAVGLVMGLYSLFFRHTTQYERINHILLLIFIGVTALAVYRQTVFLSGTDFTPGKAYWHLLADAFLDGRLYLINPQSTHDLTLFNGNWYVPPPPLPAFIVMPFVALYGAENINMVHFGITIGAINAMLIYQVLTKASSLNLISTRRTGNLWLIAVVVVGTSHWWLSVMGNMWYTSQLLTLTFTALALLFAMQRASPWLVGLSLGIAVLSRPNAFTLWPFLAGIYLYLDTREGQAVQWKRAFIWAIRSALPVCLAAGGLLYYNYIRFQDWFDFGYVTINSAGWIMEAVRTYGIFNAHFLPTNFHAMFLKMPRIVFDGSCLYLSPSREGISMLATTPALVYAVRRFTRNWWVAGAWASILLSIGLLLFYHNTGSWQLGYRYLMDFILPVLLLMGLGIGERPPWLFKGLVILGLLGNIAGIYWWYTEWWCKPV